MSKRVLLEAHNLTLSKGTGIATYARNLGSVLREIGYETDALIGTKSSIDTRDPLLSEVLMYDSAAADLPQTIIRRLRWAWHWVLGLPLGMRPKRISLGGAVVDPTGGRLAGFAQLHAVRDLSDLARLHFQRYRRPVKLRMETTPDIFHATHPIPIELHGCPNIFTIHDLIPLRLPYTTLDDKVFFLRMVRDIARRADHILTVSECSKSDIVNLLGVPDSRVTNTFQSVHIPDRLLKVPSSEVANSISRSFGLDYQEYFLFVGAIEPKKNLSNLIDAYSASGAQRPLVIVGSPAWQFKADMKKIEDEQFLVYTMQDGLIRPNRRVRLLNYLPSSKLIYLMRGARAVLFPSLYEGFGLPVLEAMLAGAPVLTSNVSSMPEVAGDAALLVDPHDVDDISRGIVQLDNDGDLRQLLVEKGSARAEKFSAARYRDRLSNVYQKILG